jgi:hypothetical protein
LAIKEWNEMMIQDFFRDRRAGMLNDEGQYGKGCAVLDLNELFQNEKIHCPQCQVWKKKVRQERGEEGIVREYYHQAVALVWVSGPIPLVLGCELVAPGEGELTAGLQLLDRLLPRLLQSLDLILGGRAVLLPALFQDRLWSGSAGLGDQLRRDGDG